MFLRDFLEEPLFTRPNFSRPLFFVNGTAFSVSNSSGNISISGFGDTLSVTVNSVPGYPSGTYIIDTSDPIPSPLLIVQPAISGTFSVGETISAVAPLFLYSGSSTPVPTYQWQRDAGSGWVDINGATSPSYTLVSADGGNSVRRLVTLTDTNGTAQFSTAGASIQAVVSNITLDTFTGSNGVFLQDHSGERGAVYSKLAGGCNFVRHSGRLVQNGAGFVPTISQDAEGPYTVAHAAQCTFIDNGSTVTSAFGGLVALCSDVDNMLYLTYPQNTRGSFQLHSRRGGVTGAPVASHSETFNFDEEYEWRMELTPNAGDWDVEIFLNGLSVMTYTETVLTTGYCGFRGGEGNGATAGPSYAGPVFDNFGVETL